MPEAAEVLCRRSTTEASSSSLPAKPSIWSAKRKLVIVLLSMLTVPWWSYSASVIIISRKMLKRVGESKHCCLSPTVVLRNGFHFMWRIMGTDQMPGRAHPFPSLVWVQSSSSFIWVSYKNVPGIGSLIYTNLIYRRWPGLSSKHSLYSARLSTATTFRVPRGKPRTRRKRSCSQIQVH